MTREDRLRLYARELLARGDSYILGFRIYGSAMPFDDIYSESTDFLSGVQTSLKVLDMDYSRATKRSRYLGVMVSIKNPNYIWDKDNPGVIYHKDAEVPMQFSLITGDVISVRYNKISEHGKAGYAVGAGRTGLDAFEMALEMAKRNWKTGLEFLTQ